LLSISNPMNGAGKGNYYLKLAREDYYLSGGEPPGMWHGSGATALGISGKVAPQKLRNLLSGFSPNGKQSLVQNAGSDRRQSGWDCTFSAPKSVSVLWSQLERTEQKKLEASHRAAVAEAIRYADWLSYSRTGKGGKVLEKVNTLWAAFEHGTSRAGDPQLHTHALLINIGVRPDGTTGTIVSRDIFRNKMKIGALYRERLLQELMGHFPSLKTEKTKIGFELSDVPKDLCRFFSKRRAQIEKELRARGESSAVDAKRAALLTRMKKETTSRKDLFTAWREAGAFHGWSTEEAHGACGEMQVSPRERPKEAKTAGQKTRNALLWKGPSLFGYQLQLSQKRLFPYAPRWNKVGSTMVLPRLLLKAPAKNKWGVILKEKNIPFGVLKLQEKKIFSKAPKWSPLSSLKAPALRVQGAKHRTMPSSASTPPKSKNQTQSR